MFRNISSQKLACAVFISLLLILTGCSDVNEKIKKDGLIRFNSTQKKIGLVSINYYTCKKKDRVSSDYMNSFLTSFISRFNKNTNGMKVIPVKAELIKSPYIQIKYESVMKEFPSYELTELGIKENKNLIEELCRSSNVDAAMNIEFILDRDDSKLYPVRGDYNAYIIAQNERFIIKTEIKDAINNQGFNYGQEACGSYQQPRYGCLHLPNPLVDNVSYFIHPRESYEIPAINALSYKFIYMEQAPYIPYTRDNDFYGAFSELDIRANKTFSYRFTLSDEELKQLYTDPKNAEKFGIELADSSLDQIANDTDFVLKKK